MECRLNTHCHLFSAGEEQKKKLHNGAPWEQDPHSPRFFLTLSRRLHLSHLFASFFWKKN